MSESRRRSPARRTDPPPRRGGLSTRWGDTPPDWGETPGGWDDTRGSWEPPAADRERGAARDRPAAAANGQANGVANGRVNEARRRAGQDRGGDGQARGRTEPPAGAPRRPAAERDVAGRWERPAAGWGTDPAQAPLPPSRPRRPPSSGPPIQSPQARAPRQHTEPPRSTDPGQHTDPHRRTDPRQRVDPQQRPEPYRRAGARPRPEPPVPAERSMADWERDPDSWYRLPAPPARHHEEPAGRGPATAPPDAYRDAPRSRRAAPAHPVAPGAHPAAPDPYPSAPQGYRAAPAGHQAPAAYQPPDAYPVPGVYPVAPEPYPEPQPYRTRPAPSPGRRQAAPARPGGPGNPPGRQGKPGGAAPKRQRHPWGMMIFLSVGMTLAIYGLVRFGYGPAAAGYKLPPCTGSAPSFTQSPTYANRTVGVATKYPYQFRVHAFANVLTRTPGIAEYYEPFPNPAGFQGNIACFFARRGILSLIQLDPTASVSLSAIAAGKYDTYLRNYAVAVKKFHAPIALSFGHEMNGWWYPWSVHLNSSAALARAKPARFIAAWQHIHDIFGKAGATNATWVWTVRQNVRLAKHPDFPGIKSWWPGSKYVDWVGMDGYFRRPNEDFNSVFGTQVTDIRAITDKPILIAETAVRMDHPGATTQISELFAGVRKTPGILGLIWFDLDAVKTGIRWNIDQNTGAIQAVRQAIGATSHKSG